MKTWHRQLHEDLKNLNEAKLLRRCKSLEFQGRTIRHHDRDLLNLGSNDYLGLANDPRLKDASIAAIRQSGTGAGASRLAGGTTVRHNQLESHFAAFKHAEAALLCPTGYQANLAAITALARKGDLICQDKLNHASLIDAARWSGATVRTFPHKQTAKLARLLEKHKTQFGSDEPTSRRLIITDSVFSMDGDCADLPALCELADCHDAILIVDEAHGTGVLGEQGIGLCEYQNVEHRVDVILSTASKALGGLGGIISSTRSVIETIVNHANPFIYTTAIPPSQIAAITAALDIIHDEPWRRRHLCHLASTVRQQLTECGLITPSTSSWCDVPTPIIPVITGTPESAITLSEQLENRGFYAPAIRPPTVGPGMARIRISLRADLENADVENLITALHDLRV